MRSLLARLPFSFLIIGVARLHGLPRRQGPRRPGDDRGASRSTLSPRSSRCRCRWPPSASATADTSPPTTTSDCPRSDSLAGRIGVDGLLHALLPLRPISPPPSIPRSPGRLRTDLPSFLPKKAARRVTGGSLLRQKMAGGRRAHGPSGEPERERERVRTGRAAAGLAGRLHRLLQARAGRLQLLLGGLDGLGGGQVFLVRLQRSRARPRGRPGPAWPCPTAPSPWRRPRSTGPTPSPSSSSPARPRSGRSSACGSSRRRRWWRRRARSWPARGLATVSLYCSFAFSSALVLRRAAS